MSTITTTAFPYTGIPSTEVTREPGHTGMAEHGSEITKHLLQGVNDRVEQLTHEADLHLRPTGGGWTDAGAQVKRQALQARDVAVHSADSLRVEIRAHPLMAVFAGVMVGVLLGRALR
ncbi:MAG: hypothetical protein Q8Q78_18765 [Hydrogenophaga sp.]|nr:hypothetical protein [Hydrogenophaga sp.]